jgi:hypothetical protein
MTESSTPGAAPERLPELRFRLPGRWWPVPLRDTEGARSSIRSLVREQVGVADEHAGLRDALARRILGTLESAIAGSGQSMYLALEIVKGAPLPATLTVFLLDTPLAPSVGTAPDRVIDVMERALVGSMTPGLDARLRFKTRESEALRAHRIVESTGDDSARTLVVDYWVSVPQTKRVVLASFSTGLVELQDELLGFFDAIVKASYWRHPRPAAADLALT